MHQRDVLEVEVSFSTERKYCRHTLTTVVSAQRHIDIDCSLTFPFAYTRSGCPPSRSGASSSCVGRNRPIALQPPPCAGQCRRAEKAKTIHPPMLQLNALLGHLKPEARFGLCIQKWAKAVAAAAWPPRASLTRSVSIESCQRHLPGRVPMCPRRSLASEGFVRQRW